MNPEDMDFDDPDFKEEYLTYMYGDNALDRYVAGEINDKLNSNSLANYVYRKIKDTFQDLECTPEAVRKYLRVYNKCSETIREKFFDNELSIKQLMDITSNFSIDEQNLIYNSDDPDAKKREILQRHRSAKKKKEKNVDNGVKHLKKELAKYAKPMMILCNELDKLEIEENDNQEAELIRELKDAISKFLNR